MEMQVFLGFGRLGMLSKRFRTINPSSSKAEKRHTEGCVFFAVLVLCILYVSFARSAIKKTHRNAMIILYSWAIKMSVYVFEPYRYSSFPYHSKDK